MPVAAATRIASSSKASGTGSLSERYASGPVSSAPRAKRRARRVKIASSAGNEEAASSASGRTDGRVLVVVAIGFRSPFAARVRARLYSAVSTTFPRMQPVLVIEQEHSLRGLGLLGDRLDASGLPYRQLRGVGRAARRARGTGLLRRSSPWAGTRMRGRRAFRSSRRSGDLLHDAVEEGVPVLGICLGGQLLARALGGDVREAERARDRLARDRSHRGCRRRSDPRPSDRADRRLPVAPRRDRAPAGRTAAGEQSARPEPGVPRRRHERLGHPVPSGGRRPALRNVDLAPPGGGARGRRRRRRAPRRPSRHGIEKSLPFQVRLFDAFLGLVRGTWHA